MTHLFVVFQIFVEAKRTSPSIIYIPSIGLWWETVGPALRATFLSLLSSIPAFAPIFLLATCSFEYRDLSAEVQKRMGHRSHSTTRETFIFDGSGFFLQMNEHDSNTFSSDLSFSGSGVVSGGTWRGFQYPTPLQHGEKKLF